MDQTHDLFRLGEKVVYPQFGLGTIAEVTQKQVNGTALNFYRLEFPVKHMEILVPVKRAKENGLRKVMTGEEVDSLLSCLNSDADAPKPQQWHQWRKKTMAQLKTGDAQEAARIYCFLRTLDRKKGLSYTERRILQQVEKMLAAEISAVKLISEDEALELLSPEAEQTVTEILQAAN